jgi:carbon storage regulator CsrA
MLVLSRRPQEKILFPRLGVSVEVLSVIGQRVRIGIEAPQSIAIVREELSSNQDLASLQAESPFLSHDHETRNRLNYAWLSVQLAQKQLALGKDTEAEATLNIALSTFESIERELTIASEKKKLLSAKPIRTLVVEDNDNENTLLASILPLSGFDVDTAKDGKDALDYLAIHECPDVLVLDMRLPRLDSPSTVSTIRCTPTLDRMKIFAVSGSPASDFSIPSESSGVDAWFSKPLNTQKLIEDLRAISIAA